MVTTVGPTYHRRSGTICLRSEPRLYAAAAAVWFPVTRVGRGWAGQDELGKIQSECKSFVILTMKRSMCSPQLADLRGGFTDCEGAGGGGRCAGEVGVVLRAPLPTPGAEGAADSEATGTGAAGGASKAPALRGGVAHPVPAEAGVTALVGELDNFEHTEELLMSRCLLATSRVTQGQDYQQHDVLVHFLTQQVRDHYS